MNARDDRFERARDAAYDAPGAVESQMPNVDAAIETATRVRITDEVLTAFRGNEGLRVHALRAAFEAAGFEVVE
jgi:hypothetical protein